MAQVFKSSSAQGKQSAASRRSPASADQMNARNELSVARAKAKARKLDTRRKIVLGGGLIALARNGDTTAQHLIQKIVEHHDTEGRQSAFEGWSGLKTGESLEG